jgi:hypothetical protein
MPEMKAGSYASASGEAIPEALSWPLELCRMRDEEILVKEISRILIGINVASFRRWRLGTRLVLCIQNNTVEWAKA